MPTTIEVSPKVTPQHVAEFKKNGFVVARGLFSQEEIATIRETFMDLAKDGPVAGISDTNGDWSKDDPLSFYPRMMHPAQHPELSVGDLSMRYMLDERIYSFLKPLMEDEPIAVQSMFYFKPAGARGQDLHQDNFYLRVKPGTCMAAWIAVDPSEEANGGMMLVPGSQNLDIACPTQADSSLYFTTDHVEPPAGMEPLMMNLKAGDCLFFNGNVIHGSSPNSTKDRFRRSLIFHYIPQTSVELSHFYQDARRFDGSSAKYELATGGGPCGTVGAAPMSPH